MKRRALLAGIASLPVTTRAQAKLPVIGYLGQRTSDAGSYLYAAFTQGLAEAGFEENRNVAIAYAYADGKTDRLKPLAAELVRRQPAVLFAASSAAAVAAKATTDTIPIVYVGASDPVKLGLVQSLARPGGNLTGYTMYSHTYSAKRLEILHELVPQATKLGVLVNPDNPSASAELQDVHQAAAALGFQAVVVEVKSEADFAGAFARLAEEKVRALYIVDDPLFGILALQIPKLALKNSIATISTLRTSAQNGGFASYGTDFAQVYHDAALYVARILKGVKPADLPVLLPTKFTLSVNQKTATALGLALSPAMLARVDEVIE